MKTIPTGTDGFVCLPFLLKKRCQTTSLPSFEQVAPTIDDPTELVLQALHRSHQDLTVSKVSVLAQVTSIISTTEWNITSSWTCKWWCFSYDDELTPISGAIVSTLLTSSDRIISNHINMSRSVFRTLHSQIYSHQISRRRCLEISLLFVANCSRRLFPSQALRTSAHHHHE